MGDILRNCCLSEPRALIDVCSSVQVKIKTKYIAVDIGKRNCKACIMNAEDSMAEESEHDNKVTEAEIFAYSMVKKYDKCIAVCESTSNLC